MRSVSLSAARRGRLPWLAFAVALLVAPVAQSQNSADPDSTEASAPEFSAVPILSVGVAMTNAWMGGQPNLHPLVSPVGLIPIGQNWLIEGRGTFESVLVPDPNTDARGWKGYLQKEDDYLQVDYIANKYVTFSFGRYITPFGIFNERLYSVWIRDLQSDPLILPISTGPSDAGTGAMARGGFNLTPKIELNYAAYFSTKLTTSPFDSDRDWGWRAGIYLPGPRLEVGGSFQHLLQADHSNAFGFHFAWQPTPLPLDIRAEYARSSNGSGYWIESAYMLSQVPVWQNEFRHVQVVARMQEYFVGEFEDEDGDLPAVNTKLFEFGLNYYFRDDMRFVSSYGRQFAPEGGTQNQWTVGVTFRPTIPIGHGDAE
jgi:hypothetical protein